MSLFERVQQYFLQELDRRFSSIVLIVCFFISGLIDSVAFNTWSCFVGMQTGNTIFAALGLSGQPASTHRQHYIKSLTGMGAFLIGSLVFNLLHRWPTPGEMSTSSLRLIFVVSSFSQTYLIILAATLVQAGVVSDRAAPGGSFSSGSSHNSGASPAVLTRTNFSDLAPIGLLAFQAAGQVCFSRHLGIPDLATNVLSGIYNDFSGGLWGIPRAWRMKTSWKTFLLDRRPGAQNKQAKRIGAALALFAGAVIGGRMYKTTVGMVGALWLAAACKGSLCLAFCFWRRPEIVEGVAEKEIELPQYRERQR